MINQEDLKSYYESDGSRALSIEQDRVEGYRFFYLQQEVTALARRMGRDRLNILDAGAGWGQLSMLLASMGHSVTSVDLAQSRLSRFAEQARSLGITQIQAPLEDIPLADQSIDLVVCSEVLEHLPNPDSAVSEFRRLTKEGGYLLASVPYAEILVQHICMHCNERFVPFGHLHSFDQDSLSALLTGAGYCIKGTRVINKRLTRRLLLDTQIPYQMAQYLDLVQARSKNRGWLFIRGRR